MTARLAQAPAEAVPSGIEPRPELIARALAALEAGDIYLQAPPGYGKSAFAALLESALPSLTVHRGLRDFSPEAADRASSLLIDDADIATGPARRQLAAWLADPGRRTNAVILMTSARGLGLVRLVSQGRGVMWTADDLRCSIEETASFLAARHPGLTSHELALTLHRRADGWWTGIVLLAEAARRAGKAPAQTPPGLRLFCRDMLAALNLPVPDEALMRCALPDQISPALFHHLTGSPAFFDLVESGIDLQPVADAPGWWRFGRLLGQHLRESSQALGADALADAHRSIAEWHFRHGLLTESAIHSLEAGDQDFAVTVINKCARGFIANGQIGHALSWLEYLEPERRSRFPRMWLHLITAQVLSGDTKTAKGELDALAAFLEETRAADATPDWFDEVELHLRYNSLMLRHLEGAAGGILDEIADLEADPRIRSFAVYGEATFLKGLTELTAGQAAQGAASTEQSLGRLRDSQSWYALATAYRTLAVADLKAGRLDACRDKCDRAYEEIAEGTGFAPPCLAPVALVRCALACVEGDTAAAWRILTDERSNLATLRNPSLLAEWTVIAAKLYLVSGQPEDALRAITDLDGRILAMAGPEAAMRLRSIRVRVLLALGQTDAARAALGGGFGLAPPRASPRSNAQKRAAADAATSAEILLALRQTARAAAQLQVLITHAKRSGDQIGALRLQRLLVMAKWQGGDANARRTARAWLNAVEAAGAYGLLGEVPPGALTSFVHQHSKRAQPTQPRVSTPPDAASPLTRKELDILSLMSVGLTNRQIAEEAVISLTTVKWHVRNILAKLDAQNRAAAINQGRLRGLIA